MFNDFELEPTTSVVFKLMQCIIQGSIECRLGSSNHCSLFITVHELHPSGVVTEQLILKVKQYLKT